MGRPRQQTSGQKFNKLIALHDDPNNRTNVIVQCECGNIKSVDRFHLVHGDILSCNKGKCNSIRKDIVGKKYGKLLIIATLFADNNYTGKVRVKCECGKEFAVDKKSVVSGHTKSCGHKLCSGQVKNIAGKKFGELTAVKFVKVNKYKQAVWECLCSCGNTTFVESKSLSYGVHKSCGCIRSIISSQTFSLPFGDAIRNRIFASYKRSARMKGMEFTLSYDQFVEMISGHCHYCGVEPNTRHEVKNIIYDEKEIYFNGVDRKYNDKGYTVKNAVPCCSDCNFAKGTMPYNRFIAWLDRIAKFRSDIPKMLGRQKPVSTEKQPHRGKR